MFGGLRERLQAARNRLSSSIGAAVAPPAAEPVVAPAASAPAAHPAEPVKNAAPSFVDKVKVLVLERELIVSEKNIADALSELEMTLLESDVALPVTDAIIVNVRKNLVGKHRKIGESVDAMVVNALKLALLDVLGKGFDLNEYIASTRKEQTLLRCSLTRCSMRSRTKSMSFWPTRPGGSIISPT